MSIRERIYNFVESDKVQNTIIALIVINAVCMGLETFAWWKNTLGMGATVLEYAFIIIFLLEVLLKIYAHGWKYFQSGWNNFDFIIVALSLVPGNGVLSCFRIVRALRIFRTARLFGRVQNLKIIICAMLKALPNLGWLFLILFIFFYIFAVLTTTVFGQIAPDKFGNIFTSFYSLFSLMTMEGWQDTVEGVNSPYSKLVFIPFMLFASYIFLNLVIGIIVTAMEDIVEKEKDADNDKILELSEKIDKIYLMLEKQQQK